MTDLSKIKEKDELHLLKILLNTQLRMRCGTNKSEAFDTNTGVPQGDSLSANQFTYYLAQALKVTPAHIDHNYTTYEIDMKRILKHDHDYSLKPNDAITINQEYADDISIITTNPNAILNQKITLPSKLSKRDLMINQTKTEEYEIKKKVEMIPGNNVNFLDRY